VPPLRLRPTILRPTLSRSKVKPWPLAKDPPSSHSNNNTILTPQHAKVFKKDCWAAEGVDRDLSPEFQLSGQDFANIPQFYEFLQAKRVGEGVRQGKLAFGFKDYDSFKGCLPLVLHCQCKDKGCGVWISSVES